jgi:hypothetical protein
MITATGMITAMVIVEASLDELALTNASQY